MFAIATGNLRSHGVCLKKKFSNALIKRLRWCCRRCGLNRARIGQHPTAQWERRMWQTVSTWFCAVRLTWIIMSGR